MKPLLALAPALFLAACAVGLDYAGPPSAAPQGIARGRFVRAGDAASANAPQLARWWDELNDATLSSLIDDALAHSPSIDVAQARIRESSAQLKSQRAGQFPSVSVSADYLHAELPSSTLGGLAGGAGAGAGAGGDSRTKLDVYNLGATASWEPDLFGGKRRGVEQAGAQRDQRFADLADAQVSLTAQVAEAYVNLRDAQARTALNQQSVALQQQSLDLTRQRYAAGTKSALDVERLQTQLQNTLAQNLPLAAQVDGYRNQLAMLTGREPGALDGMLGQGAPTPMPPVQVTVGDPAGLIARRPDVRSAERALAASTAGIGVNKAKLYPSVKFMGILGLGGSRPEDTVDLGNLTTLLAPTLSWSVLDFGRARAAVRQSEAQRDEAEAQYRQKVLAALEDAETSLSKFASARLQVAQFAQAQAAAERAAALNSQRVQAGSSSVIDQLDIERQRLAAAISLAQAKAQLTNSFVGVQKSLGLGWQAPPAT